MASSRVIASTSPVNSDLQRNSFTNLIAAVDDLQREHSRSFASMNMEDLLKNIYGDAAADDNGGVVSPSRIPKNKTVDEVWKEIVEGSGGRSREPEMTLEDFLTKAGAVTEEDVRIPEMPQNPPVFGQFQTPPPPLQHMHSSENGIGGFGVESVGFGNGIDGGMVSVAAGSNGGGAVGRAKRRRTVEEPPMDKMTQQKQRRMIKNRESAARSRERKQAYTIELESLVTQLEEENARLLREEAEQSKERFKQLMENVIPVVEKRKPPQSIRRVHSMCW